MEHNPVYLGFFKYHKFTQILPTKSAVFTQFFENPKSLKFLKLIFDVFVSQKFYKNTKEILSGLIEKKIVIKLFFRFRDIFKGKKTILSLKKSLMLFCPNSA